MPDAAVSPEALTEILVTLQQSGASLPIATAAWVRRLDDADEVVRLDAARRLVLLGRGASTAQEQIFALLPAASIRLRTWLLRVLEAIHARGDKVCDAYREALVIGDATLTIAACEGLATLGEGGAPAIDRLASCLENEDGAVARAAAYALQQIGEPAHKTLRALREHRSSQVRELAQRAMARSLAK
jgi:HEAT repeat protein